MRKGKKILLVSELKEGQKVYLRTSITKTVIVEIVKDKDTGLFYSLSNDADFKGDNCKDKKGFKYSWRISCKGSDKIAYNVWECVEEWTPKKGEEVLCGDDKDNLTRKRVYISTVENINEVNVEYPHIVLNLSGCPIGVKFMAKVEPEPLYINSQKEEFTQEDIDNKITIYWASYSYSSSSKKLYTVFSNQLPCSDLLGSNDHLTECFKSEKSLLKHMADLCE